MIIVLMGVCGSGKTTVGVALAKALRWRFLDADEFHPRASVEKMRAGLPLTDADREPWLERLADELARILAQGASAVLACSALREAYRERLARAGDVRFVYLQGDHATIAARLAARRHRYMASTLLDSQLATLEVPRDALHVDIRQGVDQQVAAIVAALVPSATAA
ncbi:MAG: gluconokinase [Casimicrobiaceae bacterium]